MVTDQFFVGIATGRNDRVDLHEDDSKIRDDYIIVRRAPGYPRGSSFIYKSLAEIFIDPAPSQNSYF
jgi:hypothetical protein